MLFVLLEYEWAMGEGASLAERLSGCRNENATDSGLSLEGLGAPCGAACAVSMLGGESESARVSRTEPSETNQISPT